MLEDNRSDFIEDQRLENQLVRDLRNRDVNMFGDFLETAEYNKQKYLERNPFPTREEIQ